MTKQAMSWTVLCFAVLFAAGCGSSQPPLPSEAEIKQRESTHAGIQETERQKYQGGGAPASSPAGAHRAN